MESAIEFLRENYNIIESTDESQARPNIGNHCRRCDFQNICPYGRNA